MATIRLLGDLLSSYDATYRDLKSGRGILDFADLALLTRDLLMSNASVKKRLAAGCKLIMVDEFQDTNPLQKQIAEMLAGEIPGENLMMVGDKNQSIFGFRDAEVGLFEEEDERAELKGYRIPLLDNFRSQPEILAFVDEVFGGEDMLAPGYLELAPKAELDPDAGRSPHRDHHG